MFSYGPRKDALCKRPLAHTTPTNHNNMPLHKIVHDKDLSGLPTKQKKQFSKEPWSTKYSSKGKECHHYFVERANNEQPFFCSE
jgi:hypothetical protein